MHCRRIVNVIKDKNRSPFHGEKTLMKLSSSRDVIFQEH